MFGIFLWNEDNDVSVVSQQWIVKDGDVTYCYWPPNRMSKSERERALFKHKRPEVDWSKYEGRILSTTGMNDTLVVLVL